MRFDKLKRLVDPARPITYGIVQAGPEIEGGTPYIRPADMTDEIGVKDIGSIKHTSPEIAQQYRRSAVKAGDLVISIGPSFGKVMEVPSELDGANLTQGTARVAPGPNLHARFAFWCLRSHHCYSQWEAGIGGATFRALNLGPLAETRIPNPNLATQRQIADFLDREAARIDLLIEKKQRLVALLEEKFAAAAQSNIDDLLNAFGKKRLKNVAVSITTGPFGSAVKQDEYIENGIPILNPAHISDGKITPDPSVTLSEDKFQELQNWRLEPGDVLMGRRGELGRCAVADATLEKSICGTGCLRLRVHPKHNSIFLQIVISSRRSKEWLDLNAVGTTMKNLNEAIVGRLPVPDVSRGAQDQFVFNFQAAKQKDAKVSNAVVASIGHLKEYRSALITAAVTGQIDVATYAKSGTTDRRLDLIQEEMCA